MQRVKDSEILELPTGKTKDERESFSLFKGEKNR